MSLISGLFTLPFGYALQAYKQTFFEFPLKRKTFFSSERIYKDDPRYNETLQKLPGFHIKKKLQPFLDHIEVRTNLIFAEALDLGFCSAYGTNSFKKGDAAVIIAPEFYEADTEACTWVIKHEVSHIKNNDNFTIHCIPGICQLAASIFGMCFLSFSSALTVSYTVGFVSQVLFTRWREAKADDFAIENSSDEELKGGLRFFKALQQANLESRTTLWQRIVISESGDSHLDINHSSSTSRIQKIEKTLLRRNIQLSETIENHKIECLCKFILDNKQEVEEELQNIGGMLGLMK